MMHRLLLPALGFCLLAAPARAASCPDVGPMPWELRVFHGDFDTTYGPMTLCVVNVKTGAVQGTYVNTSDNAQGQLAGTVNIKDLTLSGGWTEGENTGEVVFRLGEAMVLKGSWRNGDSGPWNQDWDANARWPDAAVSVDSPCPDVGPMPGDFDGLNGLYDSTYGPVRLCVVDPARGFVIGAYKSGENLGELWLVADTEEESLHGVWAQAPTYEAPEDKGEVHFAYDGEEERVIGTWRYGFEGEWHDDWEIFLD